LQRSKSRESLILRCQRIIFSAYRTDQYSDPEGYMASLGAVLEQYPNEVIVYVTDPRTGIQRKSKWPPTIAEIVGACDERAAHLRDMERYANWGKGNTPLQIEDRSVRPTLDQMKEKYGPSWGLGAADDSQALLVKQEINEAAKIAAQARVKAEYESAGLEPPKDLRFSLSLTARRDMQERDLLATPAHQPTDG
jgi:hypothetical protein